MHRNPPYVCRQLSDAFVSVFVFRQQCEAHFCLYREDNFILVRIDIRPETEQDIFKIENIFKAHCAFQEDIHGLNQDAIYLDLFGED